jgi:quinol-cytochrome oxidoreductase complex cytochrome b subunit
MKSKDTPTPARSGLPGRIWRSVFRGPLRPRDDTDRKKIVFNHLVLHFRPIRVPEKTIRYTHTFGLGGMSMVLFLLLAATGVLLMFVYEPSPGYAHDSIVTLNTDVFFGKLIRNVHYWSANLLIVVMVLHLLRTYLSGAYFAARQFNWVIGLTLLFCALASNFTGYLLPWDQLSYWAATIVTAMISYVPGAGPWLQGVIRGGQEIGPATLVNFYATHTTVLPVLIILIMGFHFWRIRKARGVVIPRSPGEEYDTAPPSGFVLTLPQLLLRELAVAMILVAFVMVMALLFDAPLGAAANPGMSPDPAKAPWYFLGFQELLFHFDPLFAVLVIPLLATIGLLMIPYVNYDEDTSGVFMASRRGRRMGGVAAAAALLVTPLLVAADDKWIDFGAWMPGISPAIANGLIPAGILLLTLVTLYYVMKKKFSATNNEAVQTMFVLLATAFAVLTAVGIWFRGSGMALVWPWNV